MQNYGKFIGVRFPDEIAEAAQKAADEIGISRSAYIRDAVASRLADGVDSGAHSVDAFITGD